MDSQANTNDGAHRWAAVWQLAWESRDVEAVVALYHPDADFSTQPFRTPYLGLAGVREYVSQAFAEEEDVHARIGQAVVDGDRASVEWWAADREWSRDHAGRDIGPAR